MSRKKKIMKYLPILILIIVLILAAFVFFQLPIINSNNNFTEISGSMHQEKESEAVTIQSNTAEIQEECLEEASVTDSQEFPNETEEKSVEGQDENPLEEAANLPITEDPIKLSDIFAESGTDAVFRCFDKDAVSYEWEYYDLSKKTWTVISEEKIISMEDELHRKISAFKVKAEQENHEMMLRCTIHYENREDASQTASLYVLKDRIKEIKADDIVLDANSYLDTLKLPVKVIYEDGSKETITGLNNLFILTTEEKKDYSTSISGNRIETVTTTITECNYCKIGLEEKELILRYYPSNQKTPMETNCKASGIDLQAPVISSVNISPYEISNVDQPMTLTINIEAEDNETPYPYLEYAFALSGTKLSENDWMRKASFDVEIMRNGIYTAYVRDQSGNVSKMEKEIITVDTKAPVILDATLSNTKDWCKSNTIMVTAEDFSDMEYRFICEADGTDSDWITYSEYAAVKNGTWIIQVRDRAGNQSEIKIVINNIDQETPVIRGITVKK